MTAVKAHDRCGWHSGPMITEDGGNGPGPLHHAASTHADTCVARVPIFSHLGADQQNAVASFARPVDLDRGELLYRMDDPVRQLFVVHTGRVKLVRTSRSGRDHLVRVVEPGDVVGEHTFLTGSRPDHAVQALETTRMCVFDHRDLSTLVRRFPSIPPAMLRSLSERLAGAEQRLALTGAGVPVRLAEYLLQLPSAGVTAEGRVVVELPVPKRDVAALLGTTPESLSRALAQLTAAGLIRSTDRTVELLDLDALEERARY